MSPMPRGSWARLSDDGMIVAPLKSIESQRWNMLFAMMAVEISRRLVRARSPWVPLRFLHTMGLLPHIRSTIFGVRAFIPSIKSDKRARIRTNSMEVYLIKICREGVADRLGWVVL
jgi:hypothetical protein